MAVPVLCRGHAVFPAEHTAKIIVVIETGLFRDFLYGEAGFFEQIARLIHSHMAQILRDGHVDIVVKHAVGRCFAGAGQEASDQLLRVHKGILIQRVVNQVIESPDIGLLLEAGYDARIGVLCQKLQKGCGGAVQTGRIHGKMIALCSLLDESAFCWHGDWYRKLVEKTLGEEQAAQCFRLYYNDNCIHDDRAGHLDDLQHQVDYLGILHQALLDVAAWVEKGTEPAPSTVYEIREGQTLVPSYDAGRGGLQPVVKLLAGGSSCVRVKTGEAVHFTADIGVPAGTGRVTGTAWDFEKTDRFVYTDDFTAEESGEKARAEASHRFNAPGVYFPTIKVECSRSGSREDIFTQCRNLDRVRVIVE